MFVPQYDDNVIQTRTFTATQSATLHNETRWAVLYGCGGGQAGGRHDSFYYSGASGYFAFNHPMYGFSGGETINIAIGAGGTGVTTVASAPGAQGGATTFSVTGKPHFNLVLNGGGAYDWTGYGEMTQAISGLSYGASMAQSGTIGRGPQFTLAGGSTFFCMGYAQGGNAGIPSPWGVGGAVGSDADGGDAVNYGSGGGPSVGGAGPWRGGHGAQGVIILVELR